MPTRDPEYIAEQLKRLRKMKSLKQQSVADMARLTVRTIEKAESGTHVPNEQTLLMIARVFGMDNTSIFDKPSEEQQRRQAAEMDWARRKTVVFPIAPVRSEHDVMSLFAELRPYGFDNDAVRDTPALDHAAKITDMIGAFANSWHDLSMTEKVRKARKLLSACSKLEEYGYACMIGQYRMQRRLPDGTRRIIGIAVVKFETLNEVAQHGTTTLYNDWETVEEDRVDVQDE